MSDCIAQGPEGWREQCKHNFYDMYDNAELAWSVVPAEVRADFELFAYRLLLLQFEEGQEDPMEAWSELAAAPMSRSFVRRGLRLNAISTPTSIFTEVRRTTSLEVDSLLGDRLSLEQEMTAVGR